MATKGRKWYHRGDEERMFFPGQELEGFIPGKSAKFKQRRSELMRGNTLHIGREPWNKGQTAETNESIKLAAEARKGQVRPNTSASLKKYYSENDHRWQGEGNFWYGKDRSGENHPRWNPEKTEFREYYNRVRYFTEKAYEANIDKINPDRLPRVLAGQDGYQLDHIVSVKYGYDNNIPPEEIGRADNLQMLWWKDNRTKGWKCRYAN